MNHVAEPITLAQRAHDAGESAAKEYVAAGRGFAPTITDEPVSLTQVLLAMEGEFGQTPTPEQLRTVAANWREGVVEVAGLTTVRELWRLG